MPSSAALPSTRVEHASTTRLPATGGGSLALGGVLLLLAGLGLRRLQRRATR